jgi:uncharacterized protein YceK
MDQHSVDLAVRAASEFLLAQRDADHLWRDYDLPPGASWAWATGWIGWALADMLDRSSERSALSATAEALCAIRQRVGWSYNPKIAPDADSTAWALRFLAAIGDPRASVLSGLLLPFITENGGVRTFNRPGRFGTWAREHADVVPIVGLALVECGGDTRAISRLREWSLRHCQANGHWLSFWWSTDSYATAWNLAFLKASGGIPDDIRQAASAWAAIQETASSAMETALQLNVMLELGLVAGNRRAHNLLAKQQPDGAWQPSAVLLVPNQQTEDRSQCLAYTDIRSLMTTALSAQSLRRWCRFNQH